MAKKFIPDSDVDFSHMARGFAKRLSEDPAKYRVSVEEAQRVAEAFEAFEAARLANAPRHTRSGATARRKDELRAVAQELIRDIGNRIRIDRTISAVDKFVVRVSERPKRLKRRECPQTAPALLFNGPIPWSNTIDGKHIILFRDNFDTTSKAKPDGAVRLELFVDLVPPDEPVPSWPGQRWGGRMWYLRSFTRSPMAVEYPKTDSPMRVVYWARWADATGRTGPFSKTLAARVEGVDRPMQAQLVGKQQTVIITSAMKQLPDSVTIIEPGRLIVDETAEAA